MRLFSRNAKSVSLSFCLEHVNFRLWSNTIIAKQKNENTLFASREKIRLVEIRL